MESSNHPIEASRLERDMATSALKRGDHQAAWDHLYNALMRLLIVDENPMSDTLIVTIGLELSNLSFLLGKGFGDLALYLKKALKSAKRTGNRRSQALINFHIGRLYYFSEQKSKAIEYFEIGINLIEDIQDTDLMAQAGEFVGLYYFIQGCFHEALPHFERATYSFEHSELNQIINPSAPMWLSYCSAYIGQFHKAIGTIDYYRRLSTDRANQTLSNTFRAALGIMLLGIRKNKEAAFHLSGALQDAIRTRNDLAGYFAKGGLSYHHFLEGRLTEAREWLVQAITDGVSSGLIRQYASPFPLEMLFNFHWKKMAPIPQMEYHKEIKRILREPNIHLKGVALRLRAKESFEKNPEDDTVATDLKESETCLLRSGDPIQLSLTWLEMARQKLHKNDVENARRLASKAWKGFSGYDDIFFPDDLRYLLISKSNLTASTESSEKLLDLFLNIIKNLTPSTELKDLLSQVVITSNRFFGAERGCIFWFSQTRSKRAPELQAAINISEADVRADIFENNLEIVFKAFRENHPQVVRFEDKGILSGQVKAVICVPIEHNHKVQGILYHDNSFLKDCFNKFDISQLAQISQSLNSYIEHILSFSKNLEQKTTQNISMLSPPDSAEIITRSPVMKNLLAQADRVATSESTVLILGETGVGKELLAQRIHKMSRRQSNPFVIVDPASIPETLVESELFGHEKGAFTGADNRKRGRLELADRGTLFIDEVGETPLSIQVKLLRVLQEKSMVRVGGTQMISSNFRLIAATNRDLAKEVVVGRFREDLYYRLNVIPINLIPLRERDDDILILARHFLSKYTTKYDRQALTLSKEHETILKAYSWPGNVRELKNVIERAVLLSEGEHIDLNLPLDKQQIRIHPFSDKPTLDEMQRRYIRHIIKKTEGKLSGPVSASEILGMKRSSLYNRMKKLGLR
jgi:transcriptional regulator with GAF, ATPase, and Fis domain